MGFDLLVEQGLGDRRIVDLAVAVAAIADEVDDHVGLESVAVVDRERGRAHHRVRVLAVDVKDGDGQALGDVRSEA